MLNSARRARDHDRVRARRRLVVARRASGARCAAIALLLLLRFACLWIGIWLGLIVGSPEAAGAVWGLLFPLTMITSAFVAPELMPGWLGTIAEWNPLSSTVTATRELFGNVGRAAAAPGSPRTRC